MKSKVPPFAFFLFEPLWTSGNLETNSRVGTVALEPGVRDWRGVVGRGEEVQGVGLRQDSRGREEAGQGEQGQGKGLGCNLATRLNHWSPGGHLHKRDMLSKSHTLSTLHLVG